MSKSFFKSGTPPPGCFPAACFADLPEAERAAINPLGNEQVLQQEWDDWQRSEQGQQLKDEQ